MLSPGKALYPLPDDEEYKLDALFRRHHETLFRRVEDRLAQHQRELRDLIQPSANLTRSQSLQVPDNCHRQPGFPKKQQSPRPRSSDAKHFDGPGMLHEAFGMMPRDTENEPPGSRPASRAGCRPQTGATVGTRPGTADDLSVFAWTLPGSVDVVDHPLSTPSPRILPPSSTPPVADTDSVDVHSGEAHADSAELPALSKENLLMRSKAGIARRHSQDMWKQKITQRLMKTRTLAEGARAFKPADMLTSRGKSEAANKQSIVKGIVFSDWFDLLSSFAILSNCVFIAAQLEYVTTEAEKQGHEKIPSWSLPVELTFCALFSIEFALRVYAHGRNIFYSKDRSWTVFDGLVVFVSVFEVSLDLAVDSDRVGSDTSFFRSMRALRVTRAIRVVRVFRFFKELRTLTVTILGSFKTLMWSAVMMVLFWYVCGVILTTATYEACSLTPVASMTLHPDCPPLKERFGTLRRSVLSLYMAMAGGVDWDAIYSIMGPMDEVYKILFLIYLFFTMFGVLNIVTGIFVESAKEARENDRDMLVRAQLRYQDKYIKDMIRLFQEIDVSGSGTISRQEFQWHLTDERALAYFEALKLDISDVATLFDLLDTSKSGGISVEEFLSGCQRLRGESRALDLAVMRTEILSWMGHFSKYLDKMEKQLEHMSSKQNSRLGPSGRQVGKAHTLAA